MKKSAAGGLVRRGCFESLGVVGIVLCLAVSCDEEEGNPLNTSQIEPQTGGDKLEEVLREVGQKHRTYYDLARIELPSYIIQSEDSMKQVIVELAARFDSTTDMMYAGDKLDASAPRYHLARRKAMQASKSDSNGIVRECFEVGTMSYCTFTWYQNGGKLKAVFTDTHYPTYWLCILKYTGEASDGFTYNDEQIQIWRMAKELNASQYIHFSKMPYCDEVTLPAYQFDYWVKGEGATLHFDGETKSLDTSYYQAINYICDGDGHHMNIKNTLILYPDESVQISLSIYSYSVHRMYLWIVYYCANDDSWTKTVYDEDGKIVKHEYHPL